MIRCTAATRSCSPPLCYNGQVLGKYFPPANTDVLAAHERDLVNYYVERRGYHGTAIDADETWQEYRSFTFHTLMTIIVSIGFGALNEEQDALMAEILRRSVAAVQRVDYAGWLEGLR